MAVQIRDYQHKAVAGTFSSISQGRRRPLNVHFTGIGKTTIAGEIVRRANSAGRRVYFLAHRNEICDQAHTRIADVFGLPCGRIAAGSPQDLNPLAQVAMVQTLVRRIDSIPKPDAIIIDEAHHAVAGAWQKILGLWSDVPHIGLTATPCRLDGKGLEGAFDAMLLGPGADEVLRRGLLIEPEVYAPSVPDMAGVRATRGDWDRADLEKALSRSTVIGDAVRSYRRWCSGMTGIVFCASVAHAKTTRDTFRAAGIRAEILTGEEDRAARADLIGRLKARDLDLLVSVDVVSEGFDLPDIQCAIMLRPTRSLSLYLQQVGRVLRPAPGKTQAVVLDHAGGAIRHGLPLRDRDWSLLGAPERKSSDVATDGTSMSVRQCAGCYGVFEAAPVCPYCGHAAGKERRMSVAQEGELKRLERDEAERLERERIAAQKEAVKKAGSLAELQAIGRAAGHHHGWARIQWDLKQGRRPAPRQRRRAA